MHVALRLGKREHRKVSQPRSAYRNVVRDGSGYSTRLRLDLIACPALMPRIVTRPANPRRRCDSWES
jgi:hypothetical protein